MVSRETPCTTNGMRTLGTLGRRDGGERDAITTTTKERKTSLLFSDDNDSEQEDKRRRDSRRRYARKIAPDDESELRLKENVKKEPNWSKIQSVRFIGEKCHTKALELSRKRTYQRLQSS